MNNIRAATILILACALGLGSDAKRSIFSKNNLVAWCVVPFDAANRGPEERARMLVRLGITRLAYDWRDRHIATFDEEADALQRHGVKLHSFWLTSGPNPREAKNVRIVLDFLKRRSPGTEIWYMFVPPKNFAELSQDAKVEMASDAVRYIAEQARGFHSKVGLYNHGGWYGEPENQLAIIARLKLDNVGMVYNFHHGVSQIDRFPEFFPRVLPHLLAINLNGMRKQGPGILPIGAGDHELGMIKIIRDSSYQGPIGILHERSDLDAEAGLNENLDGLQKVLAAIGDLLPLQELAAGFAAHPPHRGDNSDREPYYQALDRWISRPDAVYWDLKPETSNPELHSYYVNAIRKALDEAEQTKVTAGAQIWKLYSSGFLVMVPGAVFAFDAIEGPFKSIAKSPADEPGFLFQWTPEMRRRFVQLVDVIFVSHQHYDHTPYALVREMALAGKLVVVPADLKRIWAAEPFAGKLIALEGGKDHQVGPLRVRTFDGVQAMNMKSEWEWTRRPDTPMNNTYLVKGRGGVTFLHNGDNRGIEFTPWLKQAVADGWNPDIWFKIMTWPKDLVERVEQIVKPLIIPGHEYEIGHKPKFGVNLWMSAFKGLGRERFKQNRFAIITWGERFDVGQVGNILTGGKK